MKIWIICGHYKAVTYVVRKKKAADPSDFSPMHPRL